MTSSKASSRGEERKGSHTRMRKNSTQATPITSAWKGRDKSASEGIKLPPIKPSSGGPEKR